jgi:predicted dehydrogenase
MRKKQIVHDKIKIAIIGYGGMARWHHMHMMLSGKISVIGAYDIDKNASDAARIRGLKVYAAAEELLADKEVEAVLIATPNDVHEYYTVLAANAKKHIICEKPAALGSESLARMIKAANDNGVFFIVHQNRRWDKDYRLMMRLAAEPGLGRVYRVQSNVSSSHGLPGSWRKVKAKGGGMLWDWGVHLIDQMLEYDRSKVVAVTCRADYVYGFDVDDGIEMFLDFESGLTAHIVIDTNNFLKERRWRVFGENGTGMVEGWHTCGKLIMVKERLDKKNKGITAGNGFTKTMANRSRSTIKRIRIPRSKAQAKTPSFYEGFYNTLRKGEPQLISNESVMRCMKVMEAGFQSIEQKAVIRTNI